MEQRGRGGNSKPAEFWIKHLHLVEHPGEEDGFFAVPFEDTHCVLSRNKDKRPAASIAYFLQKVGVPVCGRTMFFRCQSTEMLFHHAGLPLAVLILGPEAAAAQDLRRVVLGPRVDQGHVLAFPVPADTWFTRLVEAEEGAEEDYSLYSCSLAPGFHPDDFQAATLETVLARRRGQ